MNSVALKVQKQATKAYYDCWFSDFDIAEKKRNLHYKAKSAVSRNEAIAILRSCIPTGYNEFEPELLNFLPEDSKVIIAREGSVCLYVKADDSTFDEKLKEDMKVDEMNKENGYWRLWWD